MPPDNIGQWGQMLPYPLTLCMFGLITQLTKQQPVHITTSLQ
jgi:hypothetical protein